MNGKSKALFLWRFVIYHPCPVLPSLSPIETHAQREWKRETSNKIIQQAQNRHSELGYTAVTPFPLAVDYLDSQRLPADINPREWDGFHDLIVIDELARCGYLGVIWGLGCGNSIGGPPVINFGNQEQKRRFLPDMLKGRTRFCLGVTEPDGEFLFLSVWFWEGWILMLFLL